MKTLWQHALVPALLMALLTGCMSTKAKMEAIKTVADLKSTLEKHDEAQQKAIEGLVRQTMEQQRAVLRSRWAVRKEEIKVELYSKSETRLQELRTELVVAINKALEPVEARLKTEIDSENGRGAAGAERANTLRLQLASTLAITQRETAKADGEIEDKMRQTRAQLLEELEKEFKTAPAGIDGPVTDAELDAVVAELRKALKEYRDSVGQTTDSLSAYLTADEPWKLFLKGLVGDNLFQMIAPKLTEKFGALQAQFETALEKGPSKFLESARSKLNSVKKEK